MNSFKYSISEDYFKDNDYVYQELFASDIPYFHKKIGDFHIWCEVDTKEVHIGDWYGFLTPAIIDYYIKNRDSDKVKYSKMFDYYYIGGRLNRETGEIITTAEIMTEIEKSDANDKVEAYFNNKYKKEPWCDICLSLRQMDPIVEELNKIK